MPSLASLTTSLPAANNFFSYIWDSIWNAFAGDNLFKLTLPYYFLFAISTYFYFRYKFKNNTIALFGALCGVLATGLVQLIIVGHHTKMMTFAFFPLILLTIDMMINSGLTNWKKYLIYLPVLAILMYRPSRCASRWARRPPTRARRGRGTLPPPTATGRRC